MTAQHNDSLTATFKATTGGYKKYQLGTSQIRTATFSGTTSSRSLQLVFDLEAPVHCSERSDVDSCSYNEAPALGVYPDGTKVRMVIIQ